MLSDLQSVLINTYNADPKLRADAEADLKSYLSKPEAFTSLLYFISNQEVHKDLRQAASIVVKNNAKNFFRREQPLYQISEAEKESVKSAILDISIVETNNSVRIHLAESIKFIAEFEYPDRCPMNDIRYC